MSEKDDMPLFDETTFDSLFDGIPRPWLYKQEFRDFIKTAILSYAKRKQIEVLEKVRPDCPGMLPCHCDEATSTKIDAIIAELEKKDVGK